MDHSAEEIIPQGSVGDKVWILQAKWFEILADVAQSPFRQCIKNSPVYGVSEIEIVGHVSNSGRDLLRPGIQWARKPAIHSPVQSVNIGQPNQGEGQCEHHQ